MEQDKIALLLPEIFQSTYGKEGKDKDGEKSVLSALLGVVESLHGPDEAILENLERYFDPNLVPEEKRSEFLPFLARWVDLDWVLPPDGEYEAGLDCLQNLILSSSYLASLRGTRRGLEQFLETATGLGPFTVENDRPFHIIIHCPSGAKKLRPLVQRIAEAEKPAYLTYELEFSK